jgi:hypothetical protein
MKEHRFIPLGHNQCAVVDASDYDWLNQWSWHLSSNGYARRSPRINGKPSVIYMHRLITDAQGGQEVDHINHINRNRLDNRRCNLRIATRVENLRNTARFDTATNGSHTTANDTPMPTASERTKRALPRGIESSDVCRIILSDGSHALVDLCDYEFLMQWKWTGVKNGYARRGEWNGGKGKYFLMHRVIMNAKSGQVIDHINGNRCDNRRCNLRFASNAQNQFNRRKSTGAASRYKGVVYCQDRRKKKWRASIKAGDRTLYLGHFSTEIEAAQAYDNAAKEVAEQFARLNLARE